MPGRIDSPASSPVVSVIVPVYNAEKYLNQSVQSVQNQTFPDWEMLLIDDGSGDSSGMICDQYASEDKRIRVFHTGNQGYGHARNTGLLHASGQWILFLDSDDCLDSSAMEVLLGHASNADLVMALYQTFPQRAVKRSENNGGWFSSLSQMSNKFTELYEPYFFLSVCAKLYRRSIMGNGFAVRDGQLMSDWLYNFRILPLCRGICFVPETVYYYRMADQESVSKHFHSEWLYVSKSVYHRVISLFPGDSSIENFMAQRYAYRVGQHLAAVSLLSNASSVQKFAMVLAERADSFYQLPAIRQASCNRKYADVWKAFLSNDVSTALKEAEKSIRSSD